MRFQPSFRRAPGRSLLVTTLLVIGSSAGVALAAAPEVGEPAPAFRFEAEGGTIYQNADFLGRDGRPGQGVVIAWFPKAFTPG
jgi:hypothetical protein